MAITKEALSNYHCHRWAEFPPLELYIDQVIIVMEQSLGVLAGELYPVTQNIINDYVKHKIIKPPLKKKYDSEHVASLIIITAMSHVFTIGEIKQLLEAINNSYGIEQGYNMFCDKLEGALADVFEKETAAFESKVNTVDRLLEVATTAFACWLNVKQMVLNAQKPSQPEEKYRIPNKKPKSTDK